MQVWEFQTRKYLEEVQKQELLVADLTEEQERLSQKAYSIGSPGKTDIKSQNTAKDQIADNLIRINEQKERLAAAISEYAEFRIRVTKEIHKISSQKEKQLLYQHYLKNRSFRSIADELSVSYNYTTQLHRQAIKSFWIKNRDSVLEFHQNKKCGF